jgi:hypothetical protein
VLREDGPFCRDDSALLDRQVLKTVPMSIGSHILSPTDCDGKLTSDEHRSAFTLCDASNKQQLGVIGDSYSRKFHVATFHYVPFAYD